jgi:hypothetical protein
MVKSLSSISGPRFDSPSELNFQDLTTLVLSMVGDVFVDNKAPVMTYPSQGFTN